jgi:hypothetical protein
MKNEKLSVFSVSQTDLKTVENYVGFLKSLNIFTCNHAFILSFKIFNDNFDIIFYVNLYHINRNYDSIYFKKLRLYRHNKSLELN